MDCILLLRGQLGPKLDGFGLENSQRHSYNHIFWAKIPTVLTAHFIFFIELYRSDLVVQQNLNFWIFFQIFGKFLISTHDKCLLSIICRIPYSILCRNFIDRWGSLELNIVRNKRHEILVGQFGRIQSVECIIYGNIMYFHHFILKILIRFSLLFDLGIDLTSIH